VTDNRSQAERDKEIAYSLRDAGIGTRYHDLRLDDFKLPGAWLKDWMLNHAEQIKGGASAVFHGLGLTDLIITMARGLHVNGVGVRVVPLGRMGLYLKSPDKLEELNDDVRALFIMNCADSRKGCPLYDRTMADVEWLIRQRFDEHKNTFLHFSVDDTEKALYKVGGYWSDEMLHFIQLHFDILRASDMNAAKPV
jgi:hypothetical protein